MAIACPHGFMAELLPMATACPHGFMAELLPMATAYPHGFMAELLPMATACPHGFMADLPHGDSMPPWFHGGFAPWRRANPHGDAHAP